MGMKPEEFVARFGAPMPPRFIGQSTWMSRIGFKLKGLGMRVFTNSTMR